MGTPSKENHPSFLAFNALFEAWKLFPFVIDF
jgi:hypothetical protein